MSSPFGNPGDSGAGGMGGGSGPGTPPSRGSGAGFGGPAGGFGAPAPGGPGFGSPRNGGPGPGAPQSGGQGFGASRPSGPGFDDSGSAATSFGSTDEGFGSRPRARGFDDSGPDPVSSGGAPSFATGPWHWVLAAMAAAVIGLILAIVNYFIATPTDGIYPALAFGGWALAGIVTFILLGLHLLEDTRRQASGPYIGTASQTTLYRAAAGVGLLAVVATAIEIALWASKVGAF